MDAAVTLILVEYLLLFININSLFCFLIKLLLLKLKLISAVFRFLLLRCSTRFWCLSKQPSRQLLLPGWSCAGLLVIH